MSQENVEIVRADLEALTRGDVDSAFKDAAPDATIDLSRAVGLDRGVYTVPEFRRVTEDAEPSGNRSAMRSTKSSKATSTW